MLAKWDRQTYNRISPHGSLGFRPLTSEALMRAGHVG